MDNDLRAHHKKIVQDTFETAFAERNFDRMLMCLQKGADLNAKQDNQRTYLLRAVWAEDLQMARFLLAQGADLFRRGNDNKGIYELNQSTRNTNVKKAIEDIILAAIPDEERGVCRTCQRLLSERTLDAPLVEPVMIKPKPRPKGGFKV